MLTLPIYFRGSSYYFHTRFAGRQYKRSLHTADRNTAIIRASELMRTMYMSFDPSKIKKYEIDISKGVIKADNHEDHMRAMDALSLLASITPSKGTEQPQSPIQEQRGAQQGLTLMELFDKFLLLKKLQPATIQTMRATVEEFSGFFKGKCPITTILVSDITRYQEHLAKKGNAKRTIDSKIGYIKTLLNFALKQGYLTGKNPAEGMSLLTKKQRLSEGYGIFEQIEISRIFDSEAFRKEKERDPDFYYVALLGLLTGCRCCR